jgi:uronate dehydrogenase
MNVAVVGGAGYIATHLRPALEARHTLRLVDMKPAAGAEDRSVVGKVEDPELWQQALIGMDAVLWLATAANNPEAGKDLSLMFGCDVNGFYLMLAQARRLRIPRIVLASSLSVYDPLHLRHGPAVTEALPADSWHSYGMSKRLAEFMGQAYVQSVPEATFLAMRLMRPRNDADWGSADPKAESKHSHLRSGYSWPTGPEDSRRLFLAALEFAQPGYHVIQATGDTVGRHYAHHEARRLLGWEARGE